MASYWDELNRSHCSGPPGAAPEDGFVPNCFAGMASRSSLNVLRYPMILLAGVDFSIEFWHRSENLGGGIGVTDDCDVGFWRNPTTDANSAFGATWYKYPNDAFDRCIYRTVAPLAPLAVEDAGTAVPGWHHHVVNFDRDGDMTLWRDAVITGEAIGTPFAINAELIGTMAFAAWVGADNDANSDWTDWHDADLTEFDFGHFNGIVGPVAVHTEAGGAGSLMTAAEMQVSIENRFVRNDANTVLIFDWREPEGLTGWDGDRSNIIRGISDYATVPIAAPEGADGTVIVPDVSGNGNDWTLTTRPTYNATGVTPFAGGLAGLSCCAFGSDPFFRHGGLT